MNHGGGGGMPTSMTHPPGPRHAALALGFDAAHHTSQILRVLETLPHREAWSAIWHDDAQIWTRHDTEWKATSPMEFTTIRQQHPPQLQTFHFADDCTAMVKLNQHHHHHHGTSSTVTRYLSLLRLQNEWRIIREVQTSAITSATSASSFSAVEKTIQEYLQVEHGGGNEDVKRATRLFHPHANLTTVGMADVNAASSAWSAPAGAYLEISLDTYMAGVDDQTPHDGAAAAQDAIVSIDVTGAAAVAVVRVGNGAQTMVFEDILLLGQSQSAASGYQILSKSFSSQAWPIDP